MNDIMEKENIEDMIYEVRGVQVMLDSDLVITNKNKMAYQIICLCIL